MTSQDELTISLPRIDASSVLEKIILAGIVFILALPLLGDYGMWLFPLGRDVVFKLAVEFLVLLFFVLWSLKNWKLIGELEIGNLKTPITLALLSFWIIMILSTLNSVQTDFSLWGNIYKNQGLVTWTHYVLFFFLLVTFLRDKKRWQFLANIAIFVATLVGLIALWQTMQNGLDSRAASTLNNSNYFAAYLVLLLPITFAFFLRNKSLARSNVEGLLLGSAATIQFLALIFTQTRGGYVGIAVAAFVFTILYFISIKKLSRKKIFAGAIIAVALLLTTQYALLTTDAGQSFQQKLPNFTDRFLNRQNILSDSGPRLEAWRAGWQGILERPLLGYGPENFFVAFDEHYNGSQDKDGSLAQEGSLWESWFDKAHNFIFDIGATTGFLGLFAYIAVFASALWVLIRSLGIMNYELTFVPSSGRGRIMGIGLISALTGYLAQNLLGFDTIVPGIYLMFLLGYSHFLTSKTQSADFTKSQTKHKLAKTQSTNSGVLRFCALCSVSLFVLCAFLGFVFSFKIHLDILRANRELNLAEYLAQNVGVEQAFAAFEKGREYNAPPVNPNLRRRYAVIALAYYDVVEKRCPINVTGSDPVTLTCDTLFADSEKYLARALELQNENAAAEWPRFTRNYIYAAQISHALGDYEASDLYFKKALELSPGRTSIKTEWDRLKKLRNE
jgi:O-antigen ligase